VAPGFRDDPEGESILRHYRTELVLFCALALAAFVAGVSWLGVGIVPGGFLTQLVASFIAFERDSACCPTHSRRPLSVKLISTAGIESFLVARLWHRGRSSCLSHALRTCGFMEKKYRRALPCNGVLAAASHTVGRVAL
jgi:hypothetical protein